MSDRSARIGSRAARLAVEWLEDRTVPTFLPRTGLPAPALINGQPFPPAGQGGLSIAVGNLIPEAATATALNEYVTGTGPGREGLVRVWSNTGSLLNQFVPFAGFNGGINVAVGDILGDSTPEIVVAVAGNGPPFVKVYTAQGQLLSSFVAFDPAFVGGLSVAVGNVLGGVGVGAKSEIIIGAQGGIAPHVVVTDAAGGYLRSFFAFDAGYLGGVNVAASSVASIGFVQPGNGQGNAFGLQRPPDLNAYDQLVVGAATNVPHVKTFDVWQAGSGRLDGPGGVTERLSYFAFDPALGGGVTVASGSTDGTRGAEIYAALIGTSTIRVFNGETGLRRGEFTAFPPTYSRVVNLAVGFLRGGFDRRDNSDPAFGGRGNPNRNTEDLAVVAGDGPFEQVPRLFFGATGSPAGLNGP